MIFAEPIYVHGFWVVALIVVSLVLLETRFASRLGRFISSSMQPRLVTRQGRVTRFVRILLIGACLSLSVFALMRPQAPAGVETVSGNRVRADIMIAIDVSRSMLAEDASPNRLARAKAEISEFVDRLVGHRVGLVAFAGRAAVLSPLTSDYGYFRLVLREVDTESVARGGTRIGDAVRRATRAFGPARNVPRILLLITDGEDHDSFPKDALDETIAAGIRVIAIGFGSESGSTITVTDPETGVRRQIRDGAGNVVISRLDGELLRELALATEGIYIPAGTSIIDLDSIVAEHIDPLIQDSMIKMTRKSPIEFFQWFVLGALACFLVAVWLGQIGSYTRGVRRV